MFWSIGRLFCNQKLLQDSPDHKETTEAEPSRAPCVSSCRVTRALSLGAPRSCLSPVLLCVVLCQVFVKHSEPLPQVFSFVFSLSLPLSVSLPVFLVTAFLLFFSFSPKCVSVQWIFALLCSHAVTVVLSAFLLFTFLSINPYLFLVMPPHTCVCLSTCEVPHADLQEEEGGTAKQGLLVIKTSRSSWLRGRPETWTPLSRGRRVQLAFPSMPYVLPTPEWRNGRSPWWTEAAKRAFALF